MRNHLRRMVSGALVGAAGGLLFGGWAASNARQGVGLWRGVVPAGAFWIYFVTFTVVFSFGGGLLPREDKWRIGASLGGLGTALLCTALGTAMGITGLELVFISVSALLGGAWAGARELPKWAKTLGADHRSESDSS